MSSLEGFKEIDVENISHLSETIRQLREADIPAIILGGPGIGKSEGIEAALNEGERYYDIRASQIDPIDVRGVPTVMSHYKEAKDKVELLEKKYAFYKMTGNEEKAQECADQIELTFVQLENLEKTDATSMVKWSRPEFWPTEGSGIINLEEVNTAPPSVQNTLLQPLGVPSGRDRYVGAHRIPKEYYWCATGNRKEDFCHVVPMSTAFRNRVMIINVPQPNLEGWTRWAVDHDIHPYVIGFIRFKPDYLYMPPQKNDEYVGFPTPRSWSRQVSNLMKLNLASTSLFKGAVGHAAAIEFMAYVTELKDMPPIDRLLDGSVTWEPERYKMSIIYAVITSLISRCTQAEGKVRPHLIERSMKIVNKCKPEHAAIFVSNLIRSSDKQVKADTVCNRDVTTWASKHRMLIERESR